MSSQLAPPSETTTASSSSPEIPAALPKAVPPHRGSLAGTMAHTPRWRARLDRKFYAGLDKNWDDAIFRGRILEYLRSDQRLLDLGAGAGIVRYMDFRGKAAHICGVDLDTRVEENPYLDEGRIAAGESIPYEDDRFDVVVSDNVLEHLDRPRQVFAEVRRVLKPGGLFFAKTPNRWHYVAMIARLTPLAFHRWVNRRRGRAGEDTFPTCYRANSRAQLERLGEQVGLELQSYETFESRPEYLRMSLPTYLGGIAYEKLVNASNLGAPFRAVVVSRFQKPAE